MDLIDRLVRHRWLGGLVIVLLVVTAYSFMLNAPFRSMDDATSIVENKDIRSLSNIPKVFSGSFFGDHSYYRPLVTISFMLEYAAFGLKSFWFNLDNVILHIINCFCVLALFRRIFKDREVAFWTAFLFALHPVQWEAICNVAGRSILLSALFVFISFILFIEFDNRRNVFWLAASLTSFFLGIFCKESTAILPIVLGMYLVFVSREKNKPWLSLALYFVVVFGFLMLRKLLGITQLFAWGSTDALVMGFLSFARGCITYLRLYVFPVDLYFDRSRAVFAGFADPQVLFTILFWLTALVGVWRARKQLDLRLLFLMLWFLIDFAPVSQILTSLGVQPGFISLAEHFLYVPTAAMAALIVVTVRHLWSLNIRKKICSTQVAGLAVAGMMVFFYLTTIQQSVYASNELSMLKRSVSMQPYNSRVLYSLGMNYVNRRMFETAEYYFQTAVRIDPWNIRARIALGKVLCDQGKYERGMEVYRSIANPGPFAPILEENIRLTKIIMEEAKINP